MNNLRLFLTLFLDQATSRKFLLGVWGGLAFSIAIILSTIGIMDGFERALRHGLKLSTGDITMQSRHGFFKEDIAIARDLEKAGIKNYAAAVQSESFLISEDEARGVIVRGIDHNYSGVVGLEIELSPDSVAIGSQLSLLYKINIGDEIVLTFGKGASEFKNMPALHRFKVEKIIEHGVYQKDLRSVYINLNEIQRILDLGPKINMISINVEKQGVQEGEEHEFIEKKINDLRVVFEDDFYFKPYWREFSSLIEAVKAEKFMISLILQLIVIISIFNILAFIYFINEKKAKELFLFKALGLSKKSVGRIWLKLVFLIWLFACLLSIVLVEIFRILLLKLPLFQLPAEVYQMPRLDIHLSVFDYLFVFSLALVWILLITYYLLRKLRKTSLLEGLRQEFV